MKYINFQKLTIKNFLSVGEDPVVVTFDKGINVITGINKDKDDRPTDNNKNDGYTRDGIEALKPFKPVLGEEKTQSS